MSVRRLENIIKLSGKASSNKDVKSKDPLIQDIAEKLSSHFGTRVTLEVGKKRGRILIDYYDNLQLNDILSKLGIVV
jgi:ParB family chromosome partitioning protein